MGRLQEKKYLYIQEWTGEDIKVLNELQLLTCKPVVYLINMSETDFIKQRNRHVNRIVEHIN